ncbi:hypothetical protein AV530_015154 [Patagioenas fasciata monilis]|uniref:Uncharacterized protein n=1 Tax=Patagioenas fasciata monilis TaxID=372326 RepID=A0A1V4K147_PATFA|nr:hypothetical protein AV530_015154 [Patagioenas fasciata monilis]
MVGFLLVYENRSEESSVGPLSVQVARNAEPSQKERKYSSDKMALKVPILTASEILITSCVEVQKMTSGKGKRLSEKAKVTPNSAMPETGFVTNDVA